MPAVPSVRVTIFSRKMGAGAGAGGRFLPLPVQYFVNNSTLSGASVVVKPTWERSTCGYHSVTLTASEDNLAFLSPT